ncbi:hypothetical protein LPJ72_005820, partial [Coemansia sp. Benny D160-2]
MSDNQTKDSPRASSNSASGLIAAVTKQSKSSPQGTVSSNTGGDDKLVAESIRAEQKLRQQQQQQKQQEQEQEQQEQQRLESPSITQSPPSTRVHTPKASNNSLTLSYLPKENENQKSSSMADAMHDKRDPIDTTGLVTSSTNSETAKEQRSTTMALPDYSHDRRQSGDGRDEEEDDEEYARRRSVMREGSLDSEISSSIDAKGIRRTPGIGSSTSMAAAAAAVADAVARSNISSRGSGAQRLVSPADISHQAQYTFSSPSPSMHRTPPLTNRTLPFQPSPSFSQQMEEDVQMSESPSVDDGDSEFHRDSHGLGGNLSDSGLFRHHSTSRRMQERQMSLNPSRSSTSPLEGDDDSPEAHEGVSMTAKSAVLYHAGYNSGRGAVWRFFKVVESRVSGNTDRAECLLCQKRMLGKSADMKKHIVHSCPKKCNISEDMLPILKIVKSELENPKKRAKRNSNTPMVMRADGSFGPAPSASSTILADSALVTSRIHTVSGAPSTSRSQQHFPRPSPYDTQFDVQRAKMAKYS